MRDKYKAPRKNKKDRIAKVSVPLKNAIKKIVGGKEETKYATNYQVNTPFNGVITSKTEWMYPLPSTLTVGTSGQAASGAGRIGDQISPTSLKVHAIVSLGNAVARCTDIIVNFYIFTLKDAKSKSTVSSADSALPAAFLDTGDGGFNSFNGNAWDLDLPVNRSQFNLLHKRSFRLSKGSGFLNGTGTAGDSVTGASTTFKHLHFDIPTPATLKYQYDADLTPQNFCPVMAVGYAHADGSTPDSALQDLQVSWRANLYYKDA